jgi:hypothetical protein
MKNAYSIRETEYSKKWAEENPELFTKNILEFIEQHPSKYWLFSMTITKGFFKISASFI